jgi:bifunctional DNA-binding transcriptional regulator/antitoxin component of YhaV-PrlF toxin-antitoxin module
MIETEYTRKLDACGRLVVPVKLRERMGMEIGDNYRFYVHELDGKTYLCVECYRKEEEIERAKRILREAGIEID